MTYADLLRHPLWQRKRLEILQRSGFVCEDCGGKDEELHVHHHRYRRGAKPWEYDARDLQVLCKTCHAEKTKWLREIGNDLTELSVSDLEFVAGYVRATRALSTEEAHIPILSAEYLMGAGHRFLLNCCEVHKATLTHESVATVTVSDLRAARRAARKD